MLQEDESPPFIVTGVTKFAEALQEGRNWKQGLAEALADNHTVLARALGDEGFDALARAYIAAHPSYLSYEAETT